MHLLVTHAYTALGGNAGVTEDYTAKSMQTSAQVAITRTAEIMACVKAVETWMSTAYVKTVEQLERRPRVHNGLWNQDRSHFMNRAYTTQGHPLCIAARRRSIHQTRSHWETHLMCNHQSAWK